MPVAMVGYKLRQIQAQSPIKAPKHIKPRLTKGKRNWQRQRSDLKKEKKRLSRFQTAFPQWQFLSYSNYIISQKMRKEY